MYGGVRAPDDLVLRQPLLGDGAEVAVDAHGVALERKALKTIVGQKFISF